MAQYLPHLEFTEWELDEDKINVSAFTPIVHVVELIDVDGNPFPITEYD